MIAVCRSNNKCSGELVGGNWRFGKRSFEEGAPNRNLGMRNKKGENEHYKQTVYRNVAAWNIEYKTTRQLRLVFLV